MYNEYNPPIAHFRDSAAAAVPPPPPPPQQSAHYPDPTSSLHDSSPVDAKGNGFNSMLVNNGELAVPRSQLTPETVVDHAEKGQTEDHQNDRNRKVTAFQNRGL